MRGLLLLTLAVFMSGCGATTQIARVQQQTTKEQSPLNAAISGVTTKTIYPERQITSFAPSDAVDTNFGMHDNNFATNGAYPLVPFGSFRLWDTSTMSRWSELEPSRGVYNWTNLDNFIARLNTHGVTDIIYTFGFTPSWARYDHVSTLPPANNQDFIDFITALATRYKGKITHYETWNEPFSPASWTGTMPQLVTMQNDVYTTVKAIDSTATVHTPSFVPSSTVGDCDNSDTGSFNIGSFLTANGTSNFDILDVHLYPYPTGAAPETNTGTQIDNAKCSLTTFGIGAMPVWNTEFSWGRSADAPNATDQAAWLARAYLYIWSRSIPRSYWYSYDNTEWGMLFDTNSDTLTLAGVAYKQIVKWMNGSTMTSNCALANSFWTCGLRLADGSSALAVWSNVWKSTNTANYTPDGQYTVYNTLQGNTIPVSGAVAIGESPVLFIDQPLFNDGSH